ncbi:hypothetical protein FRC06_011483 [Ceratobasidium sp. 370]|nr:hypothetical protein FRC06_011483 [Ceratobasidium sp. 370]
MHNDSTANPAGPPAEVGTLSAVEVRLPTPTPSELRSPSRASINGMSTSDPPITSISSSNDDIAAVTPHPLATMQFPSNDSSHRATKENHTGSREITTATPSPETSPTSGEPDQEINRGRNRSRTSNRSGQSSRRSSSGSPHLQTRQSSPTGAPRSPVGYPHRPRRLSDESSVGPSVSIRAAQRANNRPRASSDHSSPGPSASLRAAQTVNHRPRSFSRSRSPSPSLNVRAGQIHPPARDRPRPPITARIRRALGIATPRASLAWRLAFGITQIIVISTLLGLASQPGSAYPIPGEIDGLAMVVGKSQWETCQRPLGAWDVVWAVKAAIGMGVSVWEYWRAVRPSLDQLLAAEQEQLRNEVRRTRRDRSRTAAPAGNEGPGALRRNSSPIVWTRGEAIDSEMMGAAALRGARSIRIVSRMQEIRAGRAREERWYSRCSSFQALYGLIWFITANILLYGSLGTCRYTSPYIWWLTFGLICLGYIVIAEMLAVALVVFVLGPLVYLTINVILVCLGRHPMQPGGRMGHINPDVPKMPRALVDRIPLVMYIPVPVREEPKVATQPEPGKPAPADGIQVEHVYPPAPLSVPPLAKLKTDSSAPLPTPAPPRTRRRFFFFRRKKARPGVTKEGEAVKSGDEVDLEAGWEKNEYPFVKLEANRAACAICLTDFEPPKRIGAKGKGKDSGKGEGEEKTETNEGGTGEAEPLRLLACGHVFHRDCLDPWLVDVSGRCPTCQRPVEEEDLDPEAGSNKKRKSRRT